MPITPKFHISQTTSRLIVTIYVPHVRVSADTIDIHIDNYDVHFYSHPYLLHLSFRHILIDNPQLEKESKAKYDPILNNGTIVLYIWKYVEELWNESDLVSLIICKSIQPDLTLVMGHDKYPENNQYHSILNKGLKEELSDQLKPRYGFNLQFYNYFSINTKESLAGEMLQLPNPDETPMSERRNLRIQSEFLKWNIQRYLDDFYLFDDPFYIEAMDMIPHWSSIDTLANSFKNITTNESYILKKGLRGSYFTPRETRKLSLLTSCEIRQPSVKEIYPIILSLVDILYAYAYDHRLTQGDPTCESAWTIMILSMTLSWFEYYSLDISPLNVFQWSIRRVLIYPYIRNYDISIKVVHDVMDILKQGKCCIIRSLLEIHGILENSEYFYMQNKLYIGPYLRWIQSLDEKIMNDFVTSLDKLIKQDNPFRKSYLGLGLQEIEKKYIKDR